MVAAPNQAAALAAWGTRQNLFAEGRAKISDEPDAVAAALAHPEIPLRRAIGSKEPFSLQPSLPDVPERPRRAKPKLKVAAASPRPAKARPRAKVQAPDRARLEAAQAALSAIDRDRLQREAELQRRREALETEALAAQRDWAKARKAAEKALEAAVRAYRAAGGDA
ncbi:hypothetical protein [Caulobacter sp. D5]|uniref:hypothetical protein n=2 Tax=unclassified Caulobacter TaxID=2648921 RepID=UPI001304D38C|nr:hypothetical protein [Caulobacter sp. D5]